MEHESLLLRPEEHTTVPFSEPTGSSQHHHTLFSWTHFIIIFSFTSDLKSLKYSIPFRFFHLSFCMTFLTVQIYGAIIIIIQTKKCTIYWQ